MPDYLIYERRGQGSEPARRTALDEITAARDFAKEQNVPAGTQIDVVPALGRKSFGVDHRRQTVVTEK